MGPTRPRLQDKTNFFENIGKIRVAGTVANTKKKVGRNDKCLCGSGRKYKKCCLSKNRPTPRRQQVPPRPKSVAKTEEFRPVTEPQFDGDATVIAMRHAGVRESVIHAFLMTGRFIAPEAREMYDEETLAVWDAAIEEWKTEHGEEDRSPSEEVSPRSETPDTRE